MKKCCKKTIAASLCAILVLGLGNRMCYTSVRAKDQEKKQVYIVQTAAGNKREALGEKYEEGDTISELSCDSMQEDNFITLELTEGEAELLERDQKIDLVEKDIEVRGSFEDVETEKVESKEKEDLEWNMQAIRLDEGDRAEGACTGNRVKVALIDSGVDLFEDIEVEESINLIPGEEEVLPLFWDTSGHGTSIAGVIAARDNEEGITGIAPDVELYSARVLDGNKVAPVSRIVEAIYWAIEKDVNIISISFGTMERSEALETAVRAAHKKGILIVAAAGNHGVVEYPAAMDEVMAVGGTDIDGTACDYSAEGEEVEIVAPAEKIRTTGGFGGTLVCNGTSMAVPHVVGVAARLWEKDRTKPADFIRQLMDVAANQYGDEKKYGNGLLDYGQALNIYDEFEQSYQPWKTVEQNENKAEENNAPVQEFTDVDYVNGSWNCNKKEDPDGKTHETLADSALSANGYISQNPINANVISMVKKGAVYPDTAASGMAGMTKHPCLHGYFKTTAGTVGCNYVSNYITCTKYAKEIRGGKIYNDPGPCDVNNPSQDYLKLFANVSWGTMGGSIGTSAYNRAAFAYGVAMHTATDVYAHSVWTVQYGRLFHGTPNDYADKSNIVKERFVAAKAVAVNILKHFRDNSMGTVADFCTSVKYNAGIFKLYYFEDYLRAFSDPIANNMAVYSIK